MSSEKYYSYNELSGPKIKKINETLNTNILDATPLKYSELLNKDKYLNPCRLLWATYKIQNNMKDDEIKKKIVGERNINKVNGFLRYSNHLDTRLEYYIKKVKDIKKETSLTKKDIIKNLYLGVQNKCTLDVLSNDNNIFTKSMISQLALVPGGTGDDTGKSDKSDNLYRTINAYSASAYAEINSGLRGLSKIGSSTLNHIVNLDMVYDYFASTSVLNNEPIRLYRGMDQVFYERNGVLGNTKILGELQVGDIINDKGYVSASLDINTSLNPEFFKRNSSDDNILNINISPCCCLFTFLYPPHMPFIMMGDFNIGGFFEEYQLKGKKSTFGFTETEILLPRNLTFRIKEKLKVKNILYMDGPNEEKFIDINLIVCEVVYKLNNIELKGISQKNNSLDTSFLLYKSSIIDRSKCNKSNVGLCGDTYNAYLKEYERKIKKFNMKATWFDGDVGIKYVLSPKPLTGGYYDKYIKYKTKYTDLKKIMEGGATDPTTIMKEALLQQVELMFGIVMKGKCCEQKMIAFKNNNKKSSIVAKISDSFELLQKENTKVWVRSLKETADDTNIYNAWRKYITETDDVDKLNIVNAKLMNSFIFMINNYIFFLDNYLLDKDIINLKNFGGDKQICLNCNNIKCALDTHEYYDMPVDMHNKIRCKNGQGIDLCCNLNEIDQYCLFNFELLIEKLPKVYNDLITNLDPTKSEKYKIMRDLILDTIKRIKLMRAKMKIDEKKIIK